jgi:hypothetical protein
MQGEISRRAKREIAVGIIGVVISSYEIDTHKRLSILPKVKIESIAVRTRLSEVTFALR